MTDDIREYEAIKTSVRRRNRLAVGLVVAWLALATLLGASLMVAQYFVSRDVRTVLDQDAKRSERSVKVVSDAIARIDALAATGRDQDREAILAELRALRDDLQRHAAPAPRPATAAPRPSPHPSSAPTSDTPGKRGGKSSSARAGYDSPVARNLALADLFRPHVELQEFGGWQTYGGDAFDPWGIVVHHTAGRNDLNVVINGRSDLPGPLATAYFDRDAPHRVTLVTSGRANHAGPGSAVVLDEVRRGVAAGPSAASRGLADTVASGNSRFYGFECENLGTGAEPWPTGQYRAMVLCAAAICRHHGWTAGHVIGHLEWTRRKIDPRGFGMSQFRAGVRAHLAAWAAPVSAPPRPASPYLLEDEVYIARNKTTGESFLVMAHERQHIGTIEDLSALMNAGVPVVNLTPAFVESIPRVA